MNPKGNMDDEEVQSGMLANEVDRAALSGSYSCVSELLDRGLRATDAAVHQAARGGDVALLKLLLRQGQPMHQHEIGIAIQNGYREDIIDALIDMSSADRATYERAMESAAKVGNARVIRRLIDRKVPCRFAVMNAAAANGHIAVVQLLFKLRRSCNHDAIDMAAANNRCEVVAFLLEKKRKFSAAAILSAANRGYGDVVNMLVEKRSLCENSLTFNHAIVSAVRAGYAAIANRLMDAIEERASAGDWPAVDIMLPQTRNAQEASPCERAVLAALRSGDEDAAIAASADGPACLRRAIVLGVELRSKHRLSGRAVDAWFDRVRSAISAADHAALQQMLCEAAQP